MSTVEIAISAAVIAVVYSVVLAGEDTPLNRWFYKLAAWRDYGGWRSWIASPLGGCERCLAGQLALWLSITMRGRFDLTTVPEAVHEVITHLTSASAAVLFATAIAHGYRWMRNRI